MTPSEASAVIDILAGFWPCVVDDGWGWTDASREVFMERLRKLAVTPEQARAAMGERAMSDGDPPKPPEALEILAGLAPKPVQATAAPTEPAKAENLHPRTGAIVRGWQILWRTDPETVARWCDDFYAERGWLPDWELFADSTLGTGDLSADQAAELGLWVRESKGPAREKSEKDKYFDEQRATQARKVEMIENLRRKRAAKQVVAQGDAAV